MLRALLAIRPLFFVVSLTACLLGIAGAHADGVEIRLAPVLLTLLLTAMIHAGGNILNDYYDYLSGADTLDPHGGLPPFTGGASSFRANSPPPPPAIWAMRCSSSSSPAACGSPPHPARVCCSSA